MSDILNIAFILIAFTINLVFFQKIGTLALKTNDDFYLTISFGMVINLLTLCFFTTLSNNYILSFYIICFLNAIIFFNNFSWKNFTNLFQNYHNEIILIFLLSVFFYSFNSYYWHFDNKYFIDDVGKSFGTLHTPKYINIISFINDQNRLPFINQSYGQSLMAYFFAWNNDSFNQSLKIFLAFSQSIFFAFISNLIKPFFKKNNLWVFILSVCSTSIFYEYFLINDSGYPFIVIGYGDIYIALMITIIVARELLRSNKSLNQFQLGVMMIFLFFIAPHFFIPIFLSFLFINMIEKNFSLQAILFIFTSLILIYFFLGGVISNDLFKKTDSISGAMTFFNNKGLEIAPFLPYKKYDEVIFDYNIYINLYSILFQLKIQNLISVESFKSMFLIFLFSFKSVSLPLTGYLLNLRYKYFDNNKVNFLIYSFLLFGLISSFPFIVNGYKWELSRFNLIWILIGNFLFYYYISNKIKNKVILLIIVLATCFPTLSGIIDKVIGNFIYLS